MKCRIVFMGTPDFAVPSLYMLINQGYEVVACVTQPDRKAGRGHRLAPPPVKILAEEHNIPVYQFEKVSSNEGVALLKKMVPDLLITAAFGHILSDEILAIPQYGCINVHASLLPRLRGAAPIQWAIINGDKKTGISTMFTVKKLDAGDVLEQDKIPIPEDMTAGELYGALSELGAQTLKRTLEKLAAGILQRKPQDESCATYAPMFKKGFGQIDFMQSRQSIINLVRGTNPVPGAYVFYGEEKIRVYKASMSKMDGSFAPGEIICADDKRGLLVMAGDGVISLDIIKRQGTKQMHAKDSLRGRGMDVGYVFDRPVGDK